MSSQTHARSAPSRGRKVSQKKPYYRGGGQDDEKPTDLEIEQSGGAIKDMFKTAVVGSGNNDGLTPGAYFDMIMSFSPNSTGIDTLGVGGDDQVQYTMNITTTPTADVAATAGSALNLGVPHADKLKLLLDGNTVLDKLDNIYMIKPNTGNGYLEHTDDKDIGYNVLILPFTILKQNAEASSHKKDEYMLYLLSHFQNHNGAPAPSAADNGLIDDEEKKFYSIDGTGVAGKIPKGAWRPFFCNYNAETKELKGFLNKSLDRANTDAKKVHTPKGVDKNLLHHILCYSTGHDPSTKFDNKKLLDTAADGSGELAFNLEILKYTATELGAWATIKHAHATATDSRFFLGGIDQSDHPLLVISFIVNGSQIGTSINDAYVVPVKNDEAKASCGSYDNGTKAAGDVAYVPIAYIRGSATQGTAPDAATRIYSIQSNQGANPRVAPATNTGLGAVKQHYETPYEFLLSLVGGKDKLPKILKEDEGFKINNDTDADYN